MNRPARPGGEAPDPAPSGPDLQDRGAPAPGAAAAPDAPDGTAPDPEARAPDAPEADAPDPGAPGGGIRKFFGRRHGKTLRRHQRDLVGGLLPRLAIPGVDPRAGLPRRRLDPGALFPGARALRLEIGFGGGEHLVAEALAHPEIGHLGCEPFMNGVAMALALIEREGPANIRLHPGDARDLLDLLPDASLDRAVLLYPDPWPKRRHHERRFVQPETRDLLARCLAPGAEFRIASDVPDYLAHVLRQMRDDPRFARVAGGPGDGALPWDGWPGTRYEAKAIAAGRRPGYLTFRRTAGG